MSLDETCQNLTSFTCPICRCSEGRALGEAFFQVIDGSAIDGKMRLIACASCGLVRSQTSSGVKDYNEYYESSSYSREYLSKPLPSRDKEYLRNIASDLKTFMRASDDLVVDLGCGAGHLLTTLRELGSSRLLGLDVSASCCRLIEELHGIPCRQSSFNTLPAELKTARILVLSHVLEHIPNLDEALTSIRNSLSDDGYLYVEVPDTSLFEKYTNGYPLKMLFLLHLTHFSPLSLRNLMTSFQFEVLNSGTRVRYEFDVPIPCAWLVCRKGVGSSFVRDTALPERFALWVREKKLDPNGELALLAREQSPTYVWGLGAHAQIALGMSPLKDCNVVGFIDRSYSQSGSTIRGVAIQGPDILKKLKKGDTVVIAALSHAPEMTRSLEEIGFSGKVIVLDMGNYSEPG